MSKAKLSNDEEIKVILDGLDAGSTRDELAKILNYKDWRGIAYL